MAFLLFMALGPPIGALVAFLMIPELSASHFFVLVFVVSYLAAFKTVAVAGILFAAGCLVLAGLCKLEAVSLLPAAVAAVASGGAAIYLVPMSSGAFPPFWMLLLASVLASLCAGLVSARFFPIGHGPRTAS